MDAGADIVEKFLERSESAIDMARERYGAYMSAVAGNILGDARDAEECVSDALLAAWSSIPPQKPERLGAYLARLTRNMSLDRLRGARAGKRGGGEAQAAIEELTDLSDGSPGPEEQLELRELTDSIRCFLEALPPERRRNFLRRYWYFYPLRDIARMSGISEKAVKSQLARTRASLRAHLEKEGFTV